MMNDTSATGLKISAITRLGLGPIDLELGPGEICALMGPSGAGKTMLLRTIADLDPGDGNVFINGANRNEMPASQWRARVVYVPAISGWWEEKVGPHFAGADEDITRTMLHALGMETTSLGWDVTHLSTGERQRLGLARALAISKNNAGNSGGANVLLLDEPTSGLDEANREMAEKVISDQAKNGTTILMVTHDKAQAERLDARIINIAQGKINGKIGNKTNGGAP